MRSPVSRSWFPGRYVPVSRIQGLEILEGRRGGVRLRGAQVSATTLHGTAAELRALAGQLLRAAAAVDEPQAA